MNRKRIAALLRQLADEFDRGDNEARAESRARRTTPKHVRAPRMPSPVEKTLEVSPLNRARARDALRKRGYHLPKGRDDER